MEELKEEQNITDNENVPLVKKKRAINAPRSEKQIEAFKKAQQKRDENREKMKKEKEVKMAQIYFENKLKEDEKKQQEQKEKPPPRKPAMKYEESESESEDEIIYVKKKPPKQKNKKIVYLSDDEEDEPTKPSRILRNEPQQKPVNNIQPIDFNNFFI